MICMLLISVIPWQRCIDHLSRSQPFSGKASTLLEHAPQRHKANVIVGPAYYYCYS